MSLHRWVIAGVIAGLASPGLAAIVDDFENDTLSSEWNQNLVLSQGAGATVSYDTTTNDGTLTHSFTGANGNAQQTMLLRDDVTLGVGEYMQSKVRTNNTGGENSQLFIGLAIDQGSETPADRSNLVALMIDARTSSNGQVAVQVGTGQSVMTSVTILPDTWYWLRITRTDATTLDFSFSSNGTDYTAFDGNTFDSATITGVAAVGYFNGNARSTGTGTTQADDLQIIPEPASLALIGLGGLMIARRRR